MNTSTRLSHSRLSAGSKEVSLPAEQRPTGVLERKYVSPDQLAQMFPYSKHAWRLWYYEGRLQGCLKPNGKRGRLLIPLALAEKVMREGVPPRAA